MALKEKVTFNMFVDPDDPTTLILSPVEGEIQDGSVYNINIKGIQMADGTTYSAKESFITTPTDNYFIDINEVKDMIGSLDIPDENILRHITEAGKTAMYWAKRKLEDTRSLPDFSKVNLEQDYYPFYMFIKHYAIAESLKEYYIELISGPEKWRDMLSDLERQEEFDFNAFKALIDDFEKDAEEWLELIVTITADPKWALRGKYCYSTFHTNSNPYHRIQWGFPPFKGSYNRGY